MVASPSQDRSRSTKDALLQAAIDLLAEGGARAITHRAVAARAGVSATSTTYYFGSIQELTDEALARHVAERSADLEGLVAPALEVGGSAAEVSERVAHRSPTGPTTWWWPSSRSTSRRGGTRG